MPGASRPLKRRQHRRERADHANRSVLAPIADRRTQGGVEVCRDALARALSSSHDLALLYPGKPLWVRGTSTIAEFDIGLFVKPDRRVHCLRSTGTRESTVNALLDRMDVRVDAPIESSSLDAASGGAIPTRARHALSGAVMSVVSRLTGVQPSVQRQRIITVRPANFPKPRNTLAISAKSRDTQVRSL
jgi:hypothetical protein